MATLGASLVSFGDGRAEIRFPWSERVTQQHGFVHAGMLTTAMDSACGYAAYSLLSDQDGVLTVEYKVSLLRPASGTAFRCVGEVIKSGRTLIFTEGRAHAADDAGNETLVATISATIMAIRDRGGMTG